MSLTINILKNIGKGLVLLICLWLLALISVIFYMKEINPLLLGLYVFVALGANIGLLWPGIFRPVTKGVKNRRALFRLFFIPAALLFTAFYFAVIFYIQDLPVIFGSLAIAALAMMVLSLLVPKVMGQAVVKKSQYSRMAIFGVPTAILVLAMFISHPLIENYRINLIEQAEVKRIKAIQALNKATPVSDGTVKVYPLHIGDTFLTYGQFYGGLDGWVGLTGYFKTLVNKDTMTIPLYTYLIDHPSHGLMMVDASVSWEQANDHDGFYNHNYMVSRLLTVKNEYRLSTEQELQVQVERLGYKVENIKTVFMTHTHDDHAGGLRNLPDAKVVLSKADWEKGTSIYPYSYDLVKDNMDLITYESGEYKSFTNSHDYFGDGSVILLPTPGHSPGHTSVLLKAEGYDLLFMGDTPYTLNHMSFDEVRQLTLGGTDEEKQLESTRKGQQLVDADPNTIMLYAHDYTAYQTEYIEKFLKDGRLTEEELMNIKNYRAGVFDEEWKLKPGNMPYYIPPTRGGEPGSVGYK